jgi:hypothetical protein
MWIAVVALAFATFFSSAALAKLDSWPSWSASASSWLPLRRGSRIALVAFPVIELAVAGVLVVNPREGLLLSGGLLAAFGVGVLALLPTSRGESCGCFGAGSAGRLDPLLAARNFLLAGAAFAAFAFGHSTSHLPLPGLLIVVVAALLVLLWSESRRLERIALQITMRAEVEVSE